MTGQIDLEQIAVEQIALAMEDYPRKEGEVFSWKSEFDPQDDERRNPFKILEKLKKIKIMLAKTQIFS